MAKNKQSIILLVLFSLIVLSLGYFKTYGFSDISQDKNYNNVVLTASVTPKVTSIENSSSTPDIHRKDIIVPKATDNGIFGEYRFSALVEDGVLIHNGNVEGEGYQVSFQYEGNTYGYTTNNKAPASKINVTGIDRIVYRLRRDDYNPSEYKISWFYLGKYEMFLEAEDDYINPELDYNLPIYEVASGIFTDDFIIYINCFADSVSLAQKCDSIVKSLEFEGSTGE